MSKKKPERYTGPGYSWELAERLCERIAEGSSLTRAMEVEPGGLYSSLVHIWRKKYPEFDALYNDARMSQLESWADEIVDIADGLKRTLAQREEMCAAAGGKAKKADRIMSFGDDGGEGDVEKGNGKGKSKSAYDYHAVKRDFLRIDSRKWLLSKLNPAKWGDRVQTQVTGPEGGALMVQVVRFGDLPITEQVELRGGVVQSLPEPVVDMPVAKKGRGNGKTAKAGS